MWLHVGCSHRAFKPWGVDARQLDRVERRGRRHAGEEY